MYCFILTRISSFAFFIVTVAVCQCHPYDEDDDDQNRTCLFMVALCNRETIYIFMLWFVLLLSSSFFPRLISAAADWMSAILPHMVWP